MRLVIQPSDDPRLPWRVVGDGMNFEVHCPDKAAARYVAWHMRRDWYPSATIVEEKEAA